MELNIRKSHYSLPITHYPLPITHYPLPITHYPLPITHYPLLITHYPLLLITHYPITMLQNTNIAIVNQLIDLLNDLDSVVYRDSLRPLHYSTVGQHVRHIVEFYQCLLKGQENELVNYDARERNIQIEVDKDFTIALLEDIKKHLGDLKTDYPLSLKTQFGADEAVCVPSSFYRELTYLIEHTIHHLAIIKIGLNEMYPEIKIPQNFGVAHSTIRFRVNANN
jgi:hypothetical protein